MKRMTRLVAFLAGLTALVLVAGPAGAIANGVVDGDGHPAVGALVVDFGDGAGRQVFCSGSAIAPEVFLTAGHCTADLAAQGISDVWVSFAPTFTPSAPMIHGRYVTDPEFGTKPGNGTDTHDEAVVLLDQPAGVTPVRLPTLGLLDTTKLKGQTFTAVGYGTTRSSKTGGPHAFGFDAVRRSATQSILSLEPAWLNLSMNPSTRSGGGCYGDSGGPHFLGGADSTLEVSITITGDSGCRATDKTLRLDTTAARQFLSKYVTLP
jgi:secreted trypsin-like serine protease